MPAWFVWTKVGRLNTGYLYNEKKAVHKNFRKHITLCHARQLRANIQATCTKIVHNGEVITNQPCILWVFRDNLESLSTSDQASPLLAEPREAANELESASYFNPDLIFDTEICVEAAQKALKSAGPDQLDPKHICKGGEMLKLWLKRIYNTIVSKTGTSILVYLCFKQEGILKHGIITPIKGKGKNPLLTTNYRGITATSSLAKLFEIIILRRLDYGLPDTCQTAYQKGLSCIIDATFATQEAILKNGCQPYLCFYDIEKAFDSVELPILLKRLYDCGINGKLWRLIKCWYSNSVSQVKLLRSSSDLFVTSRGVKQGSILYNLHSPPE